MDHATMTNDPEFERELLSHVDLCYSVALALTHNPNRAVALVKETLQWACQRQKGAWDEDTMKMTLLRDLRARYLRSGRTVHNRTACGGRQLQETDV